MTHAERKKLGKDFISSDQEVILGDGDEGCDSSGARLLSPRRSHSHSTTTDDCHGNDNGNDDALSPSTAMIMLQCMWQVSFVSLQLTHPATGSALALVPGRPKPPVKLLYQRPPPPPLPLRIGVR